MSGNIRRFAALASLFSVGFFAQSASAQDARVPGFGPLGLTPYQGWWSSDFGLLSFADQGRDVSMAFSDTFKTWLVTDGSGVYSTPYGRITFSGTPGWVRTEGFGWVHFATGDADFQGWVWTERAGWILPRSTDSGTHLYIALLETWGEVLTDGAFFSFDYRKLTPTADPRAFESEVFGPVSVREESPGWLFSEELGPLWSVRGTNGAYVWSQGRGEYLDIDQNNRIWTVQGELLPRPSSGGGDGAPADFRLEDVRWLHTSPANWAITANLRSVSFPGGQICMDYVLSTRWPNITVGAVVNANPWIITKINGTYYAGTWEWLRPGQTCKPKSVVNGAHVQRAPLNGRWSPRSGETVGIFVSAPARFGQSTVAERSNIVWVEWP